MVSTIVKCTVAAENPERLGTGEPVRNGGKRRDSRSSNIDGGLVATHDDDTALIGHFLQGLYPPSVR